MPEPFVVVLPKLSNNTVEATVVAWLKAVGESVAAGEAVVSVETDKIEMEIESPVTGTVVELHAAVDEDVPVGAPLITLRTE